MPRKLIAQYGSHGRSVRVFQETYASKEKQALVRCFWRENGRRRMESLPFSRENVSKIKAFAVGVSQRLALPGAEKRIRLRMHELGSRFLEAHPVGEVWRKKTKATWLARWKVWTAFITPDRYIDTVTMDTLDQFRTAMREQHYAVNQIANHVQMVKSVYLFARLRGFIGENPIAGYRMKLSKDARRLEVPEWSADECVKILAQLNPKDVRQWRARVAVMLAAVLGTRSNALLNLRWDDVDMGRRVVRWRPELDKLARDREQPLPRDAVHALRIARVWRRRTRDRSGYVLPAVKKSRKGAYTYQALNNQLHLAAKAAKVRWIPYRAMHGFRRMVVGNVLALTGSIKRAGQWVNDRDTRTLDRSYVRERADEMRDLASAIALPQPNGNLSGKKGD